MTIASFVANVGEFVGTIASYSVFKYKSSTFIINMAIMLDVISLMSILAFYPAPYQIRYYLTLIPIFCCGNGSGLYYAGLTKTASKIDALCAQAVVMGVGIAEFSVQLLKDAVSLAFNVKPTDEHYDIALFLNNVVYYSIGCTYMLICMIMWCHVVKMAPDAVAPDYVK